MASWLRRAVSQQKRRLTDSDFDLDLSYIVEDPRRGNVIAMGVPVSGRSAAGVKPPVPEWNSTSMIRTGQSFRLHGVKRRYACGKALRNTSHAALPSPAALSERPRVGHLRDVVMCSRRGHCPQLSRLEPALRLTLATCLCLRPSCAAAVAPTGPPWVLHWFRQPLTPNHAADTAALWRNRRSEVQRFLDARHGAGGYRVYNLCSEAEYEHPRGRFGGNVAAFPCDDHQACFVYTSCREFARARSRQAPDAVREGCEAAPAVCYSVAYNHCPAIPALFRPSVTTAMQHAHGGCS